MKYRSADNHFASMSRLGKVALMPTICIAGDVSFTAKSKEGVKERKLVELFSISLTLVYKKNVYVSIQVLRGVHTGIVYLVTRSARQIP